MENDSRYFDVEDMFCNLFVIAGDYQIKKDLFTRSIERHPFVNDIEKGDFQQAYERSLLDVFKDCFGLQLSTNEQENVINDYYWVGKCYFYIQSETHKSFSYIFLKLPFEELHNMFYPYHETDISHILDIFLEKEKEHTIIELLCKRRKISVTYLSKETGIAVSTLRKYRQKDEYLYKASFNNIYRLVQFFSVPETLFLETVPTLK